MTPNCPAFVISYFAVTRLGGIVQPIDERLSPAEVRAVLEDSAAERVMIHQALWPKLESCLPELPAIKQLLGIGAALQVTDSFAAWTSGHPATPAPEVDITPDMVAELMYTSGTTGEPKGVMRSHRNVRAASRNASRGFGYTGSDVIAIAMPLSHSSALNSQMMPLLELGGALALVDKFDAPQMLNLIRAEGVPVCAPCPPCCACCWHRRFLRRHTAFPASDRKFQRTIDPATYSELKHRFASIQVMNSYGLTEASTCTVLPMHKPSATPGQLGCQSKGANAPVRRRGKCSPFRQRGRNMGTR